MVAIKMVTPLGTQFYNTANGAKQALNSVNNASLNRFAVLKDNVLTIKLSDSFFTILFEFLKSYIRDHKNTFFFDKKIIRCIDQLDAEQVAQRAPTAAAHDLGTKTLGTQKPPPPIAQSAQPVVPPASYDKVKEELLKVGYRECPNGELPPFAMSKDTVSMKPPTMNIEDAPRYVNPSPQALPALAIDPKIEALPVAEQFATFMGYLRQRVKHMDETFARGQQMYKKLVELIVEGPLTEELSNSLRKGPVYTTKEKGGPLVYVAEEPGGGFLFAFYGLLGGELGSRYVKDYALTIEQLARDHPEYDASKELAEAREAANKAEDCYRCIKEAAEYLYAYTDWKVEGKIRGISPVLDPKKETGTYRAQDVGKISGLNANFQADGVLSLLPDDNVKVSISRLKESGEWEPVPVLIKTLDNRYSLKCCTQPGQVYSLDVSTVSREMDKRGYINTNIVETHAIVIQT